MVIIMDKVLVDKQFHFLSRDHLPMCANLYADVFMNEPWNEAWTLDAAERRLKQAYEMPGFVGIGCFEQEKLLGFVLGYREGWLETEIFYLKEMCIQPILQGQGIGRSILQRLKKHLKTLGVGKLYLLTLQNSQAQQFYLKQQFTVSERWVVMGCLL